MRRTLSTLFRGQAHFKVLALLSRRQAPIRLRNLAELSGMYVRSIELAVSYLTKQRIVIRVKKNGLIVYSLNPDHLHASLLRNIFELIAEDEARLLALGLDQKAKEVLAFSDSAIRLFSKAKQ